MVTEVVPVTVITGYHREVITGYHRAVTFTACGYGTGCVKRHSAPLQHHAGGANLSSSALARNTATPNTKAMCCLPDVHFLGGSILAYICDMANIFHFVGARLNLL